MNEYLKIFAHIYKEQADTGWGAVEKRINDFKIG